jgi:heavy metal sensor kinase
MKSIRVSLIVYFLSLLLVGLGGVSVLAYRTTAETLRDKEDNARRYLKSHYDGREEDLHKDLDEAIHRRAKILIANLNRQPSYWEQFSSSWNRNPLLAFPAMPMGSFTALLQYRLTNKPRSLNQFVPIPEDWEEEDGHPWEGCQTYFPDGHIWDRTTNLAHEPGFKVDMQWLKTAELMQPHFDDVMLGGRSLRRISLQVLFSPPPRSFSPGPKKGPPQSKKENAPQPKKDSQPKGPRPASLPVYYLQYAVETTALHKRVASLNEERDRRIANLSEETRTTLQELRQQLIYICGATAGCVLVGGLVLIWIGLAPLRRLSDAVSRVNEKDFQLRLDPQTLPSELQPVAQRLSHSLDQLRKAFAREKQAAQDISHDLRTPLAALTTTIEVALKKDRTTAEYRELMEECQLSANQMSHLVERLLALARIDAGSNPARPRPLDVVQIALRAAELVRPLAKVRKIGLTTHVPSELSLFADADKLGDVLANLLHNAVDYNRDGGAIDLSVERQGDTVEIRVVDTGIGIRPEARERLFERFYRADPSRHTDTPHCGLGLAIVKSYVELLNGSIEVDSEPGKGTTFTIRLPYVRLPAQLDPARAVIDSHEVLA